MIKFRLRSRIKDQKVLRVMYFHPLAKLNCKNSGLYFSPVWFYVTTPNVSRLEKYEMGTGSFPCLSRHSHFSWIFMISQFFTLTSANVFIMHRVSIIVYSDQPFVLLIKSNRRCGKAPQYF